VPTLHVHLDESGDWVFGPKGTKHFILAAAWTYDPQPLAHALTALRFQLVSQGINIESFHASPDKQATRNLVVQTIIVPANWRFASVVMEKRKINPALYAPERFYPTFAGALLRFVLRGFLQPQTSKVLVYADTIPMDTNRKREGVLKALKTTCAQELPGSTVQYAYSHCRESNKWLQIADYCCWAIARKWEQGDSRTYNQLAPRLAKTELDITALGDGTVYY